MKEKVLSWKVPSIVLLIGLTLTMLACSLVRSWEEAHNLNEIAFRSESRLVAIKSSFNSMITSSKHLQAYVYNQLILEHKNTISREGFSSAVRHGLTEAEREGMKVMAWLPVVSHAKHQSFLPTIKQKYGHHIEPDDSSDIKDPKKEGYHIHYPLLIATISEDSNLAFGFDISSKKTYREHIRAALQSGNTVIDLHKAEQLHNIVALFLPVFKNTVVGTQTQKPKLLGFIFSRWNVGEMLEASIKSFPISGIDFYLDDIENEISLSIYNHSSRSRLKSENSTHPIVWAQEFTIAEHTWRLSAAPAPKFNRDHPVVLAWFVILFGFLISFTAAYYIWRVIIRKSEIEETVALRTAEIRRSQKSLEQTQRIAQLGGWEWNILTGDLHWSDEAFRVFGHQPQAFEPSYKRFMKSVHPDDLDRLNAAIKAAMQGKKYNIVHRIILPDGSVRSVHEQGQLEYDINNKPARLIGTVQNVTEQRRAERRLHRLAMALAETAESVVITNKEGVIRYVNRAFEKLSGYSAKEALGKTPSLVKSGQHADEYYNLMWENVSAGKSWVGTFTNRNKSGGFYEVEQTISPIHDDQSDITGYVAVQRDVTGERDRKAKMEHAQRLESLGILAGGIAHDFNNLLTAIMGNAALVKIKYAKSAPIEKNLTSIETASARAADLCKQMLAYSGQGAYEKDWIDVAALVHEMSELLQVSMSSKTRLTLKMDDVHQWTYADTSQIQQVIMNLVINASEATIGTDISGLVNVNVSNIEMQAIDFSDCLIDGELESGSYIHLQVSDNGCGMGKETRLKIFDPFFTTKFTGRGLGMSAVLGIIHAHNGAMRLESTLGQGTTFDVYFPSVENLPEQIVESIDLPVVEEPAQQKKGMVLLIDDEEYVIESTSSMLEDAGFDVVTATSAQEGINFFTHHHNQVALILLDMTMPEMDGLSCAQKLREIDKDAIIIISSGYSEEDIIGSSNDLNLNGFLQKPYSPEALLEKLKEVLSKPA